MGICCEKSFISALKGTQSFIIKCRGFSIMDDQGWVFSCDRVCLTKCREKGGSRGRSSDWSFCFSLKPLISLNQPTIRKWFIYRNLLTSVLFYPLCPLTPNMKITRLKTLLSFISSSLSLFHLTPHTWRLEQWSHRRNRTTGPVGYRLLSTRRRNKIMNKNLFRWCVGPSKLLQHKNSSDLKNWSW